MVQGSNPCGPTNTGLARAENGGDRERTAEFRVRVRNVIYSLNSPHSMAQEPHVSKKLPAILIGDADKDNSSHMERQLRRAGVKNPVLAFENGDDLLAYLSEAATRDDPMPCALLLDPRMPGANGYDPVRWIRREKGGTSVVVAIFTTSDDEVEAESASELGVEHFLKKHADLGSLVSVMSRACGCQTPEVVPPPAILPVAPAT